MRDRDLFFRAKKEFPALFLPLFGTFLAVRLLKDEIPRGILLNILNYPLRGLQETNPDGAAAVLLLVSMPLLLITEFLSALLNLGAFRLCLDRGEGKPGQRPWTILGQWRWYIGWAIWMGIVPAVWKVGKQIIKQVGFSLLAAATDDVTFGRVYACLSYWNVIFVLLSLILLSLLALSIKTAYLRSPERGFWRAVGFGLKEGLRKWPKTIGPQLKFVVPVSIGISFMTIFLSRLAFSIGGRGISKLCNLIGGLLSLLANIWVVIFYGCLAADRYDSPKQEERNEER